MVERQDVDYIDCAVKWSLGGILIVQAWQQTLQIVLSLHDGCVHNVDQPHQVKKIVWNVDIYPQMHYLALCFSYLWVCFPVSFVIFL